MFVRSDRCHVEIVQVVDGSRQSDSLGDHRHASLELLGRPGERAPVHANHFDHRPAGQEGRHRGEHLRSRPKQTDASRSEHLVATPGCNVGAQIRHFDRHMRHGLAYVRDRQRTVGACCIHDGADRGDGPRQIRLVHDRHGLGSLVDQGIDLR